MLHFVSNLLSLISGGIAVLAVLPLTSQKIMRGGAVW